MAQLADISLPSKPFFRAHWFLVENAPFFNGKK
jgi:hypothetical protein